MFRKIPEGIKAKKKHKFRYTIIREGQRERFGNVPIVKWALRLVLGFLREREREREKLIERDKGATIM